MTDQQVYPRGRGHDHGAGRHGMLLFGDDVLYMSHLATFDTADNVQVLLEVELDDRAHHRLVSDRDRTAAPLYTFDPAHFPIAELDPSGDGPVRTTMSGRAVRGHCQRGGTPILTTDVAVHRVVHFRELDAATARAASRYLSYLCFGQGDLLFLAHEITAPPHFDQVLAVRLIPGTITTMAGTALPDDVRQVRFVDAEQVRLARPDLVENRLRAGETATVTFDRTPSPGGAHGFGVQLRVERELYLEIGEPA